MAREAGSSTILGDVSPKEVIADIQGASIPGDMQFTKID